MKNIIYMRSEIHFHQKQAATTVRKQEADRLGIRDQKSNTILLETTLCSTRSTIVMYTLLITTSHCNFQ